MALYVISYDQHRDKDYTPIWTALRQWGAVRVLESVWLLAYNTSAADLRDALRKVTRDEDSLLVIELQPNSHWATFNAQVEGTNWLTNFVRRYQ